MIKFDNKPTSGRLEMDMPYENNIASLDGVSIHYKVQGTGTPTLIFVHGWGCDKSYWDAQLPHFTRTHQVVTIDLAGHGDSGSNRKRWTMAAFGEDVRAVINDLKLTQIILIGHSMGGPVCLEAAHWLKDKVIVIVGVDTFRNSVYESYTKEEIDEYLAPLQANFAEEVSNWVRQDMFTEKSDPSLIEQIASDMSTIPPRIGLETLDELCKWDLASALQKVKAPIRCINAAAFRIPEFEAQYASYFDVKYMAEIGHFVMMEDPNIFNHLLTQAIQEFTPSA